MKQKTFKDYGELSVETAEQIADIISGKPDALLCFPAGETSLGTFRHLIDLNKRRKISFEHCRIIGLDEWVGLGEMKSENCYSFLRSNLFDHINLMEKNICFFNGESSDLAEECRKSDEFVKEYGPVDMMLLGAGMNGHLGLNEPGTPFNLWSHVTDLAETTKLIGQKYFSRKVELYKGITLGIRHILEAGTVILQISGSGKAEVAERLINSKTDPDFPASVIKEHPDSWLLLDMEAARLL